MSDPTSSATAAAAPTPRCGNYFGPDTYLSLAGALLTMIVLFSALSSHFLNYGTFPAIANQIPGLVALAVDMTFILIAGDIDLSIGSVLTLTASAVSLAALGWDWGVLPAAMLGMARAILAGCATGSITVAWRIPSFIVSLGVLEMARGLVYQTTDSRTVRIDNAYTWLFSPLAFGISPAFVIALLVMFAAQAVLTRTVSGRYLTGIGTNEEAMRSASVNPKPYKIAVFALTGLLARLAALFRISRLEAADPSAGVGLELRAIVAVVIGGTSLTGGWGSVVSTFFSVLIISVLAAGLAQIGASESIKRIITGVMIVVAVVLDAYCSHRARRQGWTMATVRDVAAMAGVSLTTVSHVVNRTRSISDAVRKKVEDAVAQLHYVPSAVARPLKVCTTSIIDLLVPNSTNPYFAELSRSIEDCCEHNGYCVILCNSDDNPRKQANCLRVLQEKRIGGLVLASIGGGSALAKGLANMRTPTVIVDHEMKGVEADRVQIDHEMGAYLATRHLLELGHRNIACIGGPLSTKVSTLRVEDYRRAMARAGLEVCPQWLLESEFSSPGGCHATLGLLGGEGERPTAIVASNDMIGIGVLRAVAELNIRVPHELSVIGFDDIELSRFVLPALTTVGQSIRLLGEIAAQPLLQRTARCEEPMQRQVVAPALVLREFTVPPLVRVWTGRRGRLH